MRSRPFWPRSPLEYQVGSPPSVTSASLPLTGAITSAKEPSLAPDLLRRQCDCAWLRQRLVMVTHSSSILYPRALLVAHIARFSAAPPVLNSRTPSSTIFCIE